MRICGLLVMLPAALLPIAGIRAQNTWIVDPSIASAFPTLNAAVAAASDGDIIRIRSAASSVQRLAPLRIDKSLRILGDVPDAALSFGPLTLAVPSGKEVTLAGIRIGVHFFEALSLNIEDCQGRVAIMDSSAATTSATSRGSIRITNSANVLFSRVRDLVMWQYSIPNSGIRIDGSTVAFDRCTIRGGPADYESQVLPGPAVAAANSSVLCVDSEFRGGDGTTRGPWPGSSAMTLVDSFVSLAGTMRVEAGSLGTTPAIVAIRGTIEHEPAFVLSGNLNSTTVVVRNIPSVSATPFFNGGSGSLTIRSEVGAIAGLLLGLPGDRTMIPGVGELWIDPANLCVPVLGVQTGNLGWSVFIPWQPQMYGAQFRWQCAVVAGSTFQLSSPGGTLLR